MCRLDDHESVRLFQVAGDLGQELVRRHADRGDQAETLADFLLDRPADADRGPEQRFAAGHVQEGFIQRQRFDQRRVLLEDRPDLVRDFRIVFHAWPQEDAVRAEPLGRDGRHGTVDAERAGHVVGRRHDAAAFRRSAHDHRLADQFGSVTLLDRSVEGVHVDVQDHRQPDACHDTTVSRIGLGNIAFLPAARISGARHHCVRACGRRP